MKLLKLFTHGYARNDLYYAIRCWFNPRQKWLTKEIPNKWCDKVELIPRLIFACHINFVENEKGLDQLDMNWVEDLKAGHVSQEYVDEHRKKYKLLRDVYEYIKIQRPGLQAGVVAAYPSVLPSFLSGSFDGRSYDKNYKEVARLEKIIEKLDQWAMKSIVENVDIFWT